jgi:uncharacterized protein (TIGR02246 family)
MFDESAERRAIHQLGQALQDAWNRGDAAAYASLFTDDASFVAWNGSYGCGRQAIEDAHRRLFDGPLAGSRMALAGYDAEPAGPESLRFVRPDVAIMVTSGAVTLAGQSATGQTMNLCRLSCWSTTAGAGRSRPSTTPASKRSRDPDAGPAMPAAHTKYRHPHTSQHHRQEWRTGRGDHRPG